MKKQQALNIAPQINLQINVAVGTPETDAPVTLEDESDNQSKTRDAEIQEGCRTPQLERLTIKQKNVRIPNIPEVEKAFADLAEMVREKKLPHDAFVNLAALAQDPAFINRHCTGKPSVFARLHHRLMGLLRWVTNFFHRLLSGI